jgi:predicted enzyme related to lactoylglutathione lyase
MIAPAHPSREEGAMPHGMFAWNELLTNDVERAKAFYAATVGWAYEGMPIAHGTYWVAQCDGKPVGGIMNMEGIVPAGVLPHWFSYVEVDDVDARLTTVEANGGKIFRQPFDIEGVGRIAIIADATGAPLGWMTPKR